MTSHVLPGRPARERVVTKTINENFGIGDSITNGMAPGSSVARLNENQLAERWGVSVRTLQAARVKGGGVPFIRIGRSVRYRLEDVLAYEQARLRMSTSEKL